MIALLWAIISEQYARIHQSYSGYQQTAEQDRRNAADEIARACEGMEAFAFSDCISNRVETYYREQATNQDLQAQQDMAFWAQWMLYATSATVVVTGIGIWLVFLNLHEARKATSAAVKASSEAVEANRIMRDDRRPWIDADLILGDEIEWSREVPLQVVVKTENIGKTIASDGRILVDIYEGGTKAFPDVRDRLIEKYRLWPHEGIKILPGKVGAFQEYIILPAALFTESSSPSPPSSFSICLLVGYRDVAGVNTYVTIKNYIVVGVKRATSLRQDKPPAIKTGDLNIMKDVNRTSYT